MKQRVTIQDLTKADMPTVTEMIADKVTSLGGDLLRFEHDDGSITIINIHPGWNVYMEAHEEEVVG